MELSDTITLGILVTLAHFRHSLRFIQAKPIIYGHAGGFKIEKAEKWSTHQYQVVPAWEP